MDFVLTQTYLGDILRVVSDALLGPDIVLLLAFIAYAVFCVGSILVEALTERRNFKVNMPQFLAALADAGQENMPEVIEKSGLLNRQKIDLLVVFDYRTLPGDMLVALVRRLLNEEDNHYQRILNRNNIAVRVAPMLGLMGTLIPLGPGLAALGQNDVATLSSSLIIAFNTTVAGLASAAVCLVIARIRKTWYNGYMNALESAMASMLHKIGMLQDAGEISIEKPSDHAFLYQASLKRRGGVSARSRDVDSNKAERFGKADESGRAKGTVRDTAQSAQSQSTQNQAELHQLEQQAALSKLDQRQLAQQQLSQQQPTQQPVAAQLRTATQQQAVQQAGTRQTGAQQTAVQWQWPAQQPSSQQQSGEQKQNPALQQPALQQPTQQQPAQQHPAQQQPAQQQPAQQQPAQQQAVRSAHDQPFDAAALVNAPIASMTGGPLAGRASEQHAELQDERRWK